MLLLEHDHLKETGVQEPYKMYEMYVQDVQDSYSAKVLPVTPDGLHL